MNKFIPTNHLGPVLLLRLSAVVQIGGG